MSEPEPDPIPDPEPTPDEPTELEQLQAQVDELNATLGALAGANAVLWESARGFAHHPPRGISGPVGRDTASAASGLLAWAEVLGLE